MGTLGYGVSTKSIDVTVTATSGTYNLVVKDVDDDTDLKWTGSAGTKGTTIEAVAGLAAGMTGWSVQDENGDWQAMTAYEEDGVTLKSGGATGEETTVTFGAAYNSSRSEGPLEAGTYTDQVVFIATAAN